MLEHLAIGSLEVSMGLDYSELIYVVVQTLAAVIHLRTEWGLCTQYTSISFPYDFHLCLSVHILCETISCSCHNKTLVSSYHLAFDRCSQYTDSFEDFLTRLPKRILLCFVQGKRSRCPFSRPVSRCGLIAARSKLQSTGSNPWTNSVAYVSANRPQSFVFSWAWTFITLNKRVSRLGFTNWQMVCWRN